MEEDTSGPSSTNGTAASAHATQNGFSRRLTDDEFDRYSRQMIVPGMGKEGKLDVY
jgi:adenylyltransferase/sulfurtransferase